MKKIIFVILSLIPIKRLRKQYRLYLKNKLTISNFRTTKDKENNSFPKKIEGLLIKISGKNNIIEIENGAKFKNSVINIKSNNSHVKIKKAKYINGTTIFIYNGDNQFIEIGKDTSIESAKFYLCATGSKCIIGDDCMLSSNLQFWTGDGHQVIDRTTGNILNDKPTLLRIENHCWVGFGSKILKNSQISKNSIIATESVVTKKFDSENIIIAGNPAKVVKNNIDWNRADPFTKKEI